MVPPSPARTFVLVSLLALAACGGGTSGTTTPPPPPPPPPADFTLALSTDKALVIQGGTTEVIATVTRQGSFDGAVTVTLKDLPPGVTAASVQIAQGAASAPLTLSAQAAAPHSLPASASADGKSGTMTHDSPLTVTVGGAPGVVDTSFGGGKQVVAVGEGEAYAKAIAVQADGKVVTVGTATTAAGGNDFALTRHLRDGTLDTTFGSGGKVVTAVGAARAADTAYAVALQADGKIVVGGSSATGGTDLDFALVRYNADGSLDTAFGTGGKVVTSFGTSTDRITAIAIQPDGRIVAGGDSDSGASTTGVDFALARYNPNGSLDAGFGNAGKVITPVRANGARDSIYALVLQGVGPTAEVRIVAVGGEGDFVAARYTPSGALDGSFGSGGKIAGVFGNSTIGAANAVVLTADNKIVLAGQIQNDFALARLNIDGSIDAGFGSAGKVITPVVANWDAATAIVRQADGKLVVGGWAYEGNSSSANFVVARYGADGALDAGFGSAGTVITPVGTGTQSDSGRALALQADPRIPTVRLLQAGEASDGGYKFALLRYWL